jgi:hypothetical protein
VALGFATFCSQAFAQLPQTRIYTIQPTGMQVGTTVDLTILRGDDIEDVNRLWFSHPGISATQKTEDVDGQQKVVDNAFVVTCAPDVPEGVYEMRALGFWGASNCRRFVVSRRVQTDEVEPNQLPAQATPLVIGNDVNCRLDQGSDVDWFTFTATAGQRVVFDCLAEQIDSIMDPSLEVYDSAGTRRLARSTDVNGLDPVLVFDVPADGEYKLRAFDVAFRNGQDYHYRLATHVGPFVAFAYPPAGQVGTAPNITLYGANIGGQRTDLVWNDIVLERRDVQIPLPGDPATFDSTVRVTSVQAGEDFITYRLPTDQGTSNPVRIYLTSQPVGLEVEPNNAPESPQRLTTPFEVAGQFAQRRDTDVYEFDAKAGEYLWVEVISQRMGTTVDSYFVIDQITTNEAGEQQVNRVTSQDDDGTTAAQNIYDTNTDDPKFLLQVGADCKYRITLRDHYGATRNDPSLSYRLVVRPEQPDFRVVAVPQSPGNNQVWEAGIRRGENFGVNLYAYRRDGFDGPISVRVEGLPGGITCPGTVIGSDQNAGVLTFTAAEGVEPNLHFVQLISESQIESPVARRAVEDADEAIEDHLKTIPPLRQALDQKEQQYQQALQQRDQAQQQLDANPTDENLIRQRDERQAQLDQAQMQRDEAATAVQTADQQSAMLREALQQRRNEAVQQTRPVVHPVRAVTYAWGPMNQSPGLPRLTDRFALSVMPETSLFQITTDAYQFDANQGRQILVPVHLTRRADFADQVNLQFMGLANGANIDLQNQPFANGETDKVFRLFVRDNSPPGTYTVYLTAQANVQYSRNPDRAARLKAEFEQAVTVRDAANETQRLATEAKNLAVQNEQTAQQTLQQAQQAMQQADQTAAQAVTNYQTAVAQREEAERQVTAAQDQVNATTTQLNDAKNALAADPMNEGLKQQVATLEQTLVTQTQTLDQAKVTLDQMKVKETEADTAKKTAEDAAKLAAENVTKAQEALTLATEAKTQAEQAERDAQALAQRREQERQRAEQRSNEAANRATPQGVSVTLPSTPIVITVRAAPARLNANVPNGGNITRGQTLEVKVSVNRQNRFEGPVTLELPLPPGVTGLSAGAVTIPADQTEGTMIITAAGDATTGQLQNMVIRGRMDFEGQAAVDTPINLTVN